MYCIGNYGVKHYRADSYVDVMQIDVSTAGMGSTVFVIDTSTYYMLNSQKQWIAVDLGNAGGGDVPSVVIYDGGNA